jgi:hypothetical protein
LDKRQNDILDLDRHTLFGLGARLSLNNLRERSISNSDGTIKIQAFKNHISNLGISHIFIPLFQFAAPYFYIVDVLASREEALLGKLKLCAHY